mmetsp:Transcript_4852/g.11170  ORF Transcript_4852/g.11170 Transcript_4852/m.11170 type:complete len:208 (+) Transcript_4852:1421-2044(+)
MGVLHLSLVLSKNPSSDFLFFPSVSYSRACRIISSLSMSLTRLASLVVPSSYSFHNSRISCPTGDNVDDDNGDGDAMPGRVPSFCVISVMARSSRACLSSSLIPQWGVMSPTVASAKSWTSAILMHRFVSYAVSEDDDDDDAVEDEDGVFPNPFPAPPSFGDAATFVGSRIIVSPSQIPLVISSRLISYDDNFRAFSTFGSAIAFPN